MELTALKVAPLPVRSASDATVELSWGLKSAITAAPCDTVAPETLVVQSNVGLNAVVPSAPVVG